MSINLENLSPSELDALMQAAAEQKKKLQKARLAEVRNRLIALARDEGYTIEELFGETRAKAASSRAGRTVAPKYRHPDNAELTWTGRGKQPVWLRQLLESGRNLADLAI